MRRLLVAGNWKMNTDSSSGKELAAALAEKCGSDFSAADVLVCPPFPYLSSIGDVVAGSAVQLGAQNSYFEAPGAFTGEVANEMLKDVGCGWVILGHSERRHVLGECDATINKKVSAALSNGLKVILCVGELLSEREAEQTEAVLNTQMSGGLKDVSAESLAEVVIAYEPVWAIGTGVTASEEQAEAAHAFLRNWLSENYSAEIAESTRILYGGSVKPGNAKSLMSQPNVDGALVGGASLIADSFGGIIDAAVELAS